MELVGRPIFIRVNNTGWDARDFGLEGLRKDEAMNEWRLGERCWSQL